MLQHVAAEGTITWEPPLRQVVAALQQGVGLGRLQDGHRCTGRGTEIDDAALTRLLDDVDHILQQRLFGIDLAEQGAQLQNLFLGDDGLYAAEVGERGVLMVALQDAQLLLGRRIVHRELHQEAVGLCLGQFVRTLLLHGILRGQNGVEWRHGVRGTVDGGLPFLHYLEEGGLRLGRGTVHLVDQHEVGKDRTGVELELLRLHVKHTGAEHVAGHQVGRELHAAELGVDEPGHELGQQRLGYARHAFYQHVTAGKDGRQQQFDVLVLSDDDLADSLAERLYLLSEGRQV